MMVIAKTIKALGVVAAAYIAMTGSAYAGPAYCSSSAADKLAASFDANLVVGNVTLNTVAADDCYGHVALGNQDPDGIESFANTTLTEWFEGDPAAGGWDFLLRDEGSDATATLEGIQFTLSAPQGAVANATWELDLVDTNGAAPQNIPLTLDFLVFIKGGTEGDYFFFDDRILSADNEGKFTMTFAQGNGGAAGLSGFSLLVRDLRSDIVVPPNEDLPEPQTLALMGLGLLAVGAMRRKRMVRG